MQLNLDCIRDILLCVEENTGLRKSCYFIDDGLEKTQEIIGAPLLPYPDYQDELQRKYSNNELIYHLRYCVNSDLLLAYGKLGLYETVIADLEPKGHEFLANIRDDKIWNKVKITAGKVGSKSIEALIQIASGLVSGLIKSQLSLPN